MVDRTAAISRSPAAAEKAPLRASLLQFARQLVEAALLQLAGGSRASAIGKPHCQCSSVTK
jgi:hypothetical protein